MNEVIEHKVNVILFILDKFKLRLNPRSQLWKLYNQNINIM